MDLAYCIISSQISQIHLHNCTTAQPLQLHHGPQASQGRQATARIIGQYGGESVGVGVSPADAGELLLSKVANISLENDGLQFLPTDNLLPTLARVNRTFMDYSRREFNQRLRRHHPSLVQSVNNINDITWRDWCRFEMGENSRNNIGNHWQLGASDLGSDIDVLFELKKNDGSVIWHSCKPLEGVPGDCPECHFRLPHIVLDSLMPKDDDIFEEPDDRFPGLTSYHYWSGRSDCSLQQKSICKSIYGINTPHMLRVHVVFRRRSTGQMMTVISCSTPNQIIGEDYGNSVGGEYDVIYQNCNILFDEDDRVGTEISFSLFCSEDVDETKDSIQFTTAFAKCSKECQASATVYFRFFICDQDDADDGEELIVRAMRTWRWGN